MPSMHKGALEYEGGVKVVGGTKSKALNCKGVGAMKRLFEHCEHTHFAGSHETWKKDGHSLHVLQATGV